MKLLDVLWMTNTNVIGVTPDHPNIKYIVQYNKTVVEFCSFLAGEIVRMRSEIPKTVAFCQSLTQAGEIHFRIKQLLSKNLTDPPKLPPVLPFRMAHWLL